MWPLQSNQTSELDMFDANRSRKNTKGLAEYVSEFGLIRYRVHVAWLEEMAVEVFTNAR